MGNPEVGASVAYGRHWGQVGYGPGSTIQTKTLFAKAFIVTDGIGGITLFDEDNVAQVAIAGPNIAVQFIRRYGDNDPRYGVQITESAVNGGGDVPNREFRIANNQAEGGFIIRAVDQAGVNVNHAAVARAYTVWVSGRDEVRG